MEQPPSKELPLLLFEPHVFKQTVESVGCGDVIRMAVSSKMASEKVEYAKVDIVKEAWLNLSKEFQVTLVDDTWKPKSHVDIVWTIRKPRTTDDHHFFAIEPDLSKEKVRWCESVIIDNKVLNIRCRTPNLETRCFMPEVIGDESLFFTYSANQEHHEQSIRLAMKLLSRSFRPARNVRMTIDIAEFPNFDEVLTFEFLKNLKIIRIYNPKGTVSSKQLKFLMDNFHDIESLDLLETTIENYSEDEIVIKADKLKICSEHMTLQKLLKIDAIHIHFEEEHQIDSHDMNTLIREWLKGKTAKRLKRFSVTNIIDRIDEEEIKRNLVRLDTLGGLDEIRLHPFIYDLMNTEKFDVLRNDGVRATISYSDTSFMFYVRD